VHQYRLSASRTQKTFDIFRLLIFAAKLNPLAFSNADAFVLPIQEENLILSADFTYQFLPYNLTSTQ